MAYSKQHFLSRLPMSMVRKKCGRDYSGAKAVLGV